MEYATNGKGNLGVTLGAVGTGLGLLDGGANLLGKMLGGTNGGNSSPDDKPVTRYEMGLIRESIDQSIENSYLRGQLETTKQMGEVQKQFTEQVGFNAAIQANLNAVAGQTAALQNSFNSLTRIFVPNENVAPGWGKSIVQPAPPLPPFPYAFPYPFPYPPVTPPQAEATAPASSSTNG